MARFGLIGIGLAIVIGFLLQGLFGGVWGISLILASLMIVYLLDFAFPGRNLAPFKPFKSKMGSAYMAIAILVIGVFFIGSSFTGPLMAIPSSIVGGLTGVGVAPVTSAVTTAEPGACMIGEELTGKSSTVTLTAFDKEADTETAAANRVWIFDATTGTRLKRNQAVATGGSEVTLPAGTMINIYGGNSTGTGAQYYLDAAENICINSLAVDVDLEAHRWPYEANMSITGYDDTGVTALSAGTSNEDDYTVAVGANEEKLFYIKLKTNAANYAYQFGGWATTKFYNVSEIEIVDDDLGGSYSQDITPVHMQGLDVVVNETSGDVINRDYIFWKRNTPLYLHEWDSVKTKFTVTSHASNDPNGGGGTTALDGFAIQSKDFTWDEGSDGNMYYDYYAHTASQADVGLTENMTSPVGKQTSMVVEFT